MRATYRITEDDYVNVRRLASKPSRLLFIVYLVIAFTLILIAALGPISVKGGSIGALIGAFIFTIGELYIISPIISRRHYRKYKAIQEDLSVELLDDGIRFSSSDGAGKLTWDKTFKWRQNKNYFLIYQAPKLFHVIPKRIESGGFDISLLSSRLSEHVGKPS